VTTNERLFVLLFEEEEKEEKENGKLNAKSFFISFVFVFVFFIKASEGKRGTIGIIDSSAPIRRRGRNGVDDSRGGNEDEEETKRRFENKNDEKEEQLLDSRVVVVVVVHFCAKVVTEEALRIVISLSLLCGIIGLFLFARDFSTVFCLVF
jgi:hypothetical protein